MHLLSQFCRSSSHLQHLSLAEKRISFFKISTWPYRISFYLGLCSFCSCCRFFDRSLVSKNSDHRRMSFLECDDVEHRMVFSILAIYRCARLRWFRRSLFTFLLQCHSLLIIMVEKRAQRLFHFTFQVSTLEFLLEALWELSWHNTTDGAFLFIFLEDSASLFL